MKVSIALEMKRSFQEFERQFGMDIPSLFSAKRSRIVCSNSFPVFENAKQTENTEISKGQGNLLEAISTKNERGPLGLKLRKSPSLLEFLQVNLSLQRHLQHSNTETTPSTSATAQRTAQEKKKAANLPASRLRIGGWEFASKYESDLVVKSYFSKRKLVWEILQNGLKNKIEIQWSDISGIRAIFPQNKASVLEVELLRPPVFFKESNPQPRKHTIWQATSDFTGGQATVFRKHVLQFPFGTFEKHYYNLLESDSRLRRLSTRPLAEGKGHSPCFSSRFVPFTIHLQHEYYLSFAKNLNLSTLQNSKPPYSNRDSCGSFLRSQEADEQTSSSYHFTSADNSCLVNELTDASYTESRAGTSSSAWECTCRRGSEFLNEISEYLLKDYSESRTGDAFTQQSMGMGLPAMYSDLSDSQENVHCQSFP